MFGKDKTDKKKKKSPLLLIYRNVLIASEFVLRLLNHMSIYIISRMPERIFYDSFSIKTITTCSMVAGNVRFLEH